MGLTAFVDVVGAYLREELTPQPPLVGEVEPDGPAQLPAVALSLAAVTTPHRGVGAAPRPTVTGALARAAAIALDAPYIDFPDGRFLLLTGQRKVLQLPYGAIVRRDGTQQAPFGPLDLTVAIRATPPSKPFRVVDAAPKAGQVRPTPTTGELVFGAALPVKGILDVSYFVGMWEVRSEHFAGELRVDAFAGAAQDADALSRRVEAALAPDRARRITGLRLLVPTACGTLAQTASGARRRSLTYRFDYEREEPVVVTAGGPITRAHVTSALSADPAGSTEQFDATRKEG